MRREEKKQVAEALARELDQAGIIYLTDFTGLDVQAITDLRTRFREQGVRYRVVKNTAMRRALEKVDLPDIDEHLRGPTALAMTAADPLSPAKVIKEFAKDHEDRPVVKIGIVDRQTVTPGAVLAMADLPPHDQLLGSIAGGLTASVAGIVGALEAVIRDIAHMVEEVARRREGAE